MNLSRIAEQRPHLVVAFALGLVALGVVGVRRLPADVLPALRVPVAMVATFYPGMGAPDIEQTLTYPIERAVSQASHIDHIESRSLAGVSLVEVFFQPGYDVSAGVSELVSLTTTAVADLPPGILPPMVVRFDPSATPIARVILSSDRLDEARLYEVAYNQVRNTLAGIPGVVAPPIFGGKVRQVMVYLDPQRLRSDRLTPMDVVRAVSQQNVELPSSRMKTGTIDYRIYTDAMLPTLERLAQVPVAERDGAPIPLSDVASVEDASAIQVNAIRVDGRRSVYIPIFRQDGASTLAVVSAVRRTIKGLTGLPDGVRVSVAFDLSSRVRSAIVGLAREGAIGGLLAFVATILFLGSVRAALPILALLPLALLGGFAGLWLSGQTLNTMTLAGLVLAFGPIVDAGIVAVENVVRLRERGVSAREASWRGPEEVTSALVTVTLLMVAAFLPVLFLQGLLFDLFGPLAFASVLAQVTALGAVLLIVPPLMRSSRLAEHRPGAGGRKRRLQRAFKLAYLRLVRRGVRRPTVALGLLALVLVAGLGGAWGIGVELYPQVDPGAFLVDLEADAGTRFERSEQLAAIAEQEIRRIVPAAELSHLLTDVGFPRSYSALYSPNDGPQSAQIAVALTADHARSAFEDMRLVREALAKSLPGVRVRVRTTGLESAAINHGAPAPVRVEVRYQDQAAAFDYADRLVRTLSQLPGAADVGLAEGRNYPEFHLSIDREKAAAAGVSVSDIAKDVITATSSSTRLKPTFFVDEKTGLLYYVGVQLREEQAASFDDLLDLPVAFPGGRTMPLRNLSRVSLAEGPVEVAHDRLRRVLHVLLTPDRVDVASLDRKVRQAIERDPPPRGVEVSIAGEVQRMRDSAGDLGLGTALGIFAMYLFMLALFSSGFLPAVVLGAIPPAIAGALLGLRFTGQTLNVQSYIGLVMLIGIAASNAVLLVDVARTLERKGVPNRAAATCAAARRFRPVLMTAFATALSMLPLAFAFRPGEEANVPLARAIIFGLMLATPITLLAVPAALSLRSAPRGSP